jgi:hypothetical protein
MRLHRQRSPFFRIVERLDNARDGVLLDSPIPLSQFSAKYTAYA